MISCSFAILNFSLFLNKQMDVFVFLYTFFHTVSAYRFFFKTSQNDEISCLTLKDLH